MRIWKQNLLIIMMLIGLVSSCNPAIPARTSPIPAVTSATPTTVPEATFIPTIFPQPTIASSATDMPLSQIELSCWPIKPLKTGNDIKGSFFYMHSFDKSTFISIWDLSSFHDESHDVNSGVEIESSLISFNGSTVVALTNKNLILISREGIHSFPLPEELINDSQYIIEDQYPSPDGHILIRKAWRYPDFNDVYKQGVGLTYIFYIFDPVTGKITQHKLFLPDLYINAGRMPRIYFSPNMKYVLYSATPTKDIRDRFIVYDIEVEKIVLDIPPQYSSLHVTNGEPHWLPDDNRITAEFYDENTHSRDYYIVSLDGKISRVTKLPNFISITSSLLSNPTLNWSPNQHFLVSADTHLTLYIYDNQAKILYEPCLPNEKRSIAQPDPIWSFDGNSFVTTLVFLSDATPSVNSSGQIVQPRIIKKYILDLVNKVIYEIPENVNGNDESYEFLGWVNWEIP